MPVNNNALFRYRILDSCFKNKYRNYTIEDLLVEVNKKLIDLTGNTISLRQLELISKK